MNDLTEFLLARIDEDEATAHVEQIDVSTFEDLSRAERVFVPGGPVTNVEHRVLAECEAKRRIIGWHRNVDGFDLDGASVSGCGVCVGVEGDLWFTIRGPCLTARLLALPYADRPGYREEWRP